MAKIKKWTPGPDDSFHKIWIAWRDGKTTIWFSLDWRHQNSKRRNPQLGIQRFRKYVSANAQSINRAWLWDHRTNNLKILFLGNGIEETDPHSEEWNKAQNTLNK